MDTNMVLFEIMSYIQVINFFLDFIIRILVIIGLIILVIRVKRKPLT